MNNLRTEQLEFHCEKGIDFLLTWINDLSEYADLSLQEHAVSLLVSLIRSFPTINLNFLCAYSLLCTHSKLPEFNGNSMEIFSAMVPEFEGQIEYFKEIHAALQQHCETLADMISSVTIFEEIKVKTRDILKTNNDLTLIANILQIIYIHYSTFDSFSSSEKAMAVLQVLKYLDCIEADLLNEQFQSPCYQLLISLCDNQIDEEIDNTTNSCISFSASPSMSQPSIENNYFIDKNEENFTLEKEKDNFLSEFFSNSYTNLLLSSQIKQENH